MNTSTKDTQMNTNLGRAFFVLSLLVTTLFAQKLADYTLTTSNPAPYLKEALTITFKAQQRDHTDTMFFFLEPQKSDDYEIHLLNKTTKELSYHNTTTTFTYILFPLKAKELRVGFDFTIKVASDEAVAQVYTGGRDNVKWINTDDTSLTPPPLVLHVQPLKHPVDVVGDFTLTSQVDKHTMNEYDSLKVLYTLKGVGYKEDNITLLEKNLEKDQDITLFFDTNDAYAKLTQEGYNIKREFF
jgi:hypothetical protein